MMGQVQTVFGFEKRFIVRVDLVWHLINCLQNLKINLIMHIHCLVHIYMVGRYSTFTK
jgi:hypothetical protein